MRWKTRTTAFTAALAAALAAASTAIGFTATGPSSPAPDDARLNGAACA